MSDPQLLGLVSLIFLSIACGAAVGAVLLRRWTGAGPRWTFIWIFLLLATLFVAWGVRSEDQHGNNPSRTGLAGFGL